MFSEKLKSIRRVCDRCAKRKSLQVHHKRYISGLALWEYDVSDLEVLCEDCHREQHGLPPQKGVALRTKEEVEAEERSRHEFLLRHDPYGSYAHIHGEKKANRVGGGN